MTHFRCPVPTLQLALFKARLSFLSQQKDMVFNHSLTLVIGSYEETSEPCVMVKSLHFRARLPRFKSWHGHFQALRPVTLCVCAPRPTHLTVCTTICGCYFYLHFTLLLKWGCLQILHTRLVRL